MASLAEKIAYARKRLEECERPLFIYDDDTDGVASFLTLYRAFPKGVGMINKLGKTLDDRFLPKITECRPDVLFVLDVAVMDPQFPAQAGCEIIWIDHHPNEAIAAKNLTQLNPHLHGEEGKPTSYWAYRIVQREAWIAMIGIAGDWWVIPEMSEKLHLEYPNLLPPGIKDPGQQKFDTPLGHLSNIIQFNLKGTAAEAMQSVKILTRVDSPYEILEQSSARGRFIHKKYAALEKKYRELFEQVKPTDEPLIVHVFEGDAPFASEIANEVIHRNPGKEAIICRAIDDKYVCAVRGSKHDIRKPMLAAFEGLDGSGGGHDKSCGMRIRKEHWDAFLQRFKKELYG